MIATKRCRKKYSFQEIESNYKNRFKFYFKDEPKSIPAETKLFEVDILPENHVSVSEQLDSILELIQYKVATKKDIEASTKEIIESQKKDISEAKILIKELITELQQRSTANIFILTSCIGLIFSLCFLIVSIFNEIKLSYFHFAISSVAFGLVLVMSFLSKRFYK